VGHKVRWDLKVCLAFLEALVLEEKMDHTAKRGLLDL